MGCEQSCLIDDRKVKVGSETSMEIPVFRRPRFISKKSPPANEKIGCSDIPTIEMTTEQKTVLMCHYRQTMLDQKPDIFHKTMLMCMQSSPKLNEIIACQMYCYRDLTKWPKLNHLCQSQLKFYDKIINIHKLDEFAIAEAIYSLGVIHYRYAQYGLKPHFLDMWQQNLEQIATKLKFSDEAQKQLFLESLGILNSYVTSIMNLAYSRCQMSQMGSTKLFEDHKEEEI